MGWKREKKNIGMIFCYYNVAWDISSVQATNTQLLRA